MSLKEIDDIVAALKDRLKTDPSITVEIVKFEMMTDINLTKPGLKHGIASYIELKSSNILTFRPMIEDVRNGNVKLEPKIELRGTIDEKVDVIYKTIIELFIKIHKQHGYDC